ncbi:unnamed protein product, partial [Mesorhabditis belari]|uniref:Uncharacterized protein n=1 Tax=Mesorhabditis belari TaxID=2138241 RepID=A0AAF3J6V3_9BILA
MRNASILSSFFFILTLHLLVAAPQIPFLEMRMRKNDARSLTKIMPRRNFQDFYRDYRFSNGHPYQMVVLDGRVFTLKD